MRFRFVGRNRGAQRRLFGTPNGSAFEYQHVEIHAVLRQGDTTRLGKVATSIPRRIAETFTFPSVGTQILILPGRPVATNMPPGSANIAKTLQIHCVSRQVHAIHWIDLRNVTLQPSPNTGNSCGFASFAGIGVRSGAFLAPQTDQYLSTNTWKFMLFCVRATSRDPEKWRLPSRAASQNPLNFHVLVLKY